MHQDPVASVFTVVGLEAQSLKTKRHSHPPIGSRPGQRNESPSTGPYPMPHSNSTYLTQERKQETTFFQGLQTRTHTHTH